MLTWFQVGLPTVITDFLSAPIFRAKPKPERFAAEREIVWQTYQAASKRRDTRGMNAASAEMQRLTTAQLRAELGR